MTGLITQYLLQYKRVTIPHVGTLEIHQQPAELNFVDRLLQPPRYTGVLTKEEVVPNHQLDYFVDASGNTEAGVQVELENLGKKIHRNLSAGPFSWQGLGTIVTGGLPFSLDFQPWEAVKAEKVSREDARHAVLVGDRELLSGGHDDALPAKAKKRSLVTVIAWILLALGVAAVLWLLYTGRFSITSFGLRSTP